MTWCTRQCTPDAAHQRLVIYNMYTYTYIIYVYIYILKFIRY